MFSLEEIMQSYRLDSKKDCTHANCLAFGTSSAVFDIFEFYKKTKMNKND